MKPPSADLRKYSDERLLNVAIYKDVYGYPFDYVEQCKEELRRRGYSNQDILAEIRRQTEENDNAPPDTHFTLQRRIQRSTKVMWLSAAGAPLCLLLLFIAGRAIDNRTAKIIGGVAIGLFCLFFLAYAWRNILRTQVNRSTDQHSSIFRS